MSVTINWKDGVGQVTSEALTIDPGSGQGSAPNSLSSVLNQGIDRELDIEVSDGAGASDTIKVIQEGCREPYVTSDGQRWLTSDGQVFGLLKEECPDGRCVPPGMIMVNDTCDTSTGGRVIVGELADVGPFMSYLGRSSHRYLGKVTGDGQVTICQLDDSDSTKYHDGTSADLTGPEGDVFMRMPRFVTYHQGSGNSHNIGFAGIGSDFGDLTVKEWGGDLMGVYPGFVENGKLRSVSGKAPTIEASPDTIIGYAAANGTGFSCMKLRHHNILGVLFMARYKDTDSSNILGMGYYNIASGQSDTIGMADTVAGGNGDGFVNFWGLEGIYGNVTEVICDAKLDDSGIHVTEDDGTVRDLPQNTITFFGIKMIYGDNLDLIPTSYSLTSKGYGDVMIMGSTHPGYLNTYSNRNAGGSGLFAIGSGETGMEAYAGRLFFDGEIVEEKDPAVFKSLETWTPPTPSYITLDQTKTSPTEMITGDVDGTEIQWIKDNSHRVLAKYTGPGEVTVCRLNDNNSTMYHDGSSADLTGSEGDVFMRLPRFYYHSEETSTDVWKIGFCRDKVDETWKEWDGNELIGVYKGSVADGKLRSVSGKTPTINTSQTGFKAYARANGNGYTLVKFKHHSMMAFLFYAFYGNTNSQAICGTGTSVTSAVSGDSNVLGMLDTNAAGGGGSDYVNYWGLENWWGSVNEFVDNVSINNRVWTITEDGGSTRDVQAGTSDGFISKVHVGDDLDMAPSDAGSSATTGFCDHYWQSSSNALVLARSCSASSTYGGVAYANAYYDASHSDAVYGSRLAFHGGVIEEDDVTAYKALETYVPAEPSYITLDQTLTDPLQMISGDVNGTEIQWIRQNSHRYLAKRDPGDNVMAICRLDDTDSTLYADGQEAELDGTHGDVFMRLPRFYYHAEEIDTDVWSIGFCRDKVSDDWKEWDGRDMIGVYKGTVSDGKLHSWSGQTPTVSVSQSDFKTYAQASGEGFSLVRFKHHSMMAFLFYALYGYTNSQAICGAGSSAQGKVTGGTNGYGMTDTVAGGNGDTGSINFWGLENWWGDLYEWIDNVSANSNLWTITEDGGSTREVEAANANGYISKVLVGNDLDMTPVGVGASDSTGFCDYYYRLSDNGVVLSRSSVSPYTNGGIAYIHAANLASYTGTDIGSRLAFRGETKEIASSSEFIAIQ